MSSENNDPRSVQLNLVIADYLAAVESGNAPAREWIRLHPNLADDTNGVTAET